MSQLDRYLEPDDVEHDCPHRGEDHESIEDCEAYDRVLEEDARIEEADARRKGAW